MRGRSTKIIITSAVVLLVAFLVFAIHTLLQVASPFLNTQRKIDAEIAKIKAKGEPVTPAELAPPPVPDSQNGAIIYETVFEIIKTPQGKKDFEIIGEFVSPRGGKRNAELWSQAREAVARNKGIIELVEDAQARPKCRFIVDWSNLLDAKFPHYTELRSLTRFLYANALINAKDGNIEEAINSLQLGLKLTESFRDEHSLISLLVKIAITKMMDRSIYEVFTYGNVTESQAERLYEAVSEVDYNNDLGKSLQGERVMGIGMFQQVHQTSSIDSTDNKKPGDSSQPLPPSPLKFVLGADEVYYLRNMAEQIRSAEVSYREAMIKRIDEKLDKDPPKYALFSRINSLSCNPARRYRDTAMAELDGTQILLACHAYHDRYNAYPKTLNELRTKLGWKLPRDIFSGKDMVYRPQNRGFILYSVGSDLKDNGGHPPKKFGSYNDGDDIVWKMEH